jgi:hypothetical protein
MAALKTDVRPPREDPPLGLRYDPSDVRLAELKAAIARLKQGAEPTHPDLPRARGPHGAE